MALVLFGIVVSSGVAHTFLIETQISSSRADLSGEESMRVIGTESGFMDTLFERGHIFFNIYNSPDEQGNHLPVEQNFALAHETGADFLVKLIPDEDGVALRLWDLAEPASVHRYYQDISLVEIELDGGERWAALGRMLGIRMLDVLAEG